MWMHMCAIRQDRGRPAGICSSLRIASEVNSHAGTVVRCGGAAGSVTLKNPTTRVHRARNVRKVARVTMSPTK